jgi:uncharacterized membrane protein SpoIIM required for sporulation
MGTMDPHKEERWDKLRLLLDRVDRRSVGALSVAEVKHLCRLYRQVTIDLSQARTDGADPGVVRYLNHLAARAHGRVYASKRVDLRPLFTFVVGGFPRLVRRRAGPILVSVAVFLASSLASFFAVVREPELAYALFDPNLVEYENVRLEEQQGEYKGNFTFSLDISPLAAVGIIANNITVAIKAFAMGALGCVLGLLLLVYNGRMLGTLSGLMWNHGYFLPFYSLILAHGVLELTAICISGGAGLLLGWSLIAPGSLPRRDSLRQAAPDAFGLLAGSALMLVAAGLIEGYVTPHCPAAVRWSVAGASALFLVFYFGWAGRSSSRPRIESATAQTSPPSSTTPRSTRQSALTSAVVL